MKFNLSIEVSSQEYFAHSEFVVGGFQIFLFNIRKMSQQVVTLVKLGLRPG